MGSEENDDADFGLYRGPDNVRWSLLPLEICVGVENEDEEAKLAVSELVKGPNIFLSGIVQGSLTVPGQWPLVLLLA